MTRSSTFYQHQECSVRLPTSKPLAGSKPNIIFGFQAFSLSGLQRNRGRIEVVHLDLLLSPFTFSATFSRYGKNQKLHGIRLLNLAKPDTQWSASPCSMEFTNPKRRPTRP
ncbi:hypothetical protein MPTK1_4g06500 [Marchantia polymorpha subsp. ruderalis]|uniref:Uncharacterized protein n=2 Tax=Marchantia polymorpha TaxID=3197 RepID=A0AAF6B715_MARPO|nr:hypothetical protein MARPO_0114s0008 [Marchantia polymorpha]BBN07799.1 hypothetical protein Mp_4g06500 [Marchantia polymorpha subsp. ruderalis]|eukprot:PTQ31181.1 hypothetical protein MARPO_0114s0008 [Marchantia polymorpha]